MKPKNLLAALAVLAVAFSIQPAAAERADIKQMVVEEAVRAGMKPSLALAVAKVESDFQIRALSKAGARGVMQVMPATARGEYGISADRLWNARVNIWLGIDFLARLIERYDGRVDLALSHYNGGTLKGRKPHSYTQGYINKVMAWEKRYAEQQTIWMASVEQEEPAPRTQGTYRDRRYESYDDYRAARERRYAMAELRDELDRRDYTDNRLRGNWDALDEPRRLPRDMRPPPPRRGYGFPPPPPRRPIVRWYR